MRSAEWGCRVRSMENEMCGSAEYGKRGIWKMRNMENEVSGKREVLFLGKKLYSKTFDTYMLRKFAKHFSTPVPD